MRSPKQNKIFSFAALILALIFAWNQIAWADGIGSVASIVRESARKEAPSPVPVSEDFLKSFTPASETGSLRRSIPGTREGVVIQIQDAHAHAEAQRRIADILAALSEKHGL